MTNETARAGKVSADSPGEAIHSIVSSHQIIDLTLTLEPRVPVAIPGGLGHYQTVKQWYTWPADKRDWVRWDGPEPQGGRFIEFLVTTTDHAGTHCDSPAHWAALDEDLPEADEVESVLARKTTVDKIPLEPLMGPACVIDVRYLIDTVEPGEDTILAESPLIEPEHVQKWEEEYGAIQAGEIPILYTGWTDKYFKRFPEGLKFDRSHPAPTAELINYLAEKGVRHLATDAMGIGILGDDYSPHHAASMHEMVATEKLCNLGLLPPRGAYFIFLPLKISTPGGMGRALAIV